MSVPTFPRYGRLAQVVMTVVLTGMAVFFTTMAVLVSHESELSCEGPSCSHIERYPFGVVQRQSLPKIANADVEWSTGGRSRALKLVLRHEDGSFTEYQGVGKNGERAERTARAINAFLASPSEPQTHPLREGSLPFAVLLFVLALGGLLLVPTFFTRVRLERAGSQLQVHIGRWPARARALHLEVPAAGFAGRLIPGASPEQTFFGVEVAGVELGMRFHSEAATQARVDALNQWWRTGEVPS